MFLSSVFAKSLHKNTTAVNTGSQSLKRQTSIFNSALLVFICRKNKSFTDLTRTTDRAR